MLMVGWPGRNARARDHGERRHRRVGVPIPHITVVLLSMPVIAVVTHDAAAHAETTDDVPGETMRCG
jgi:hypothetical protein